MNRYRNKPGRLGQTAVLAAILFVVLYMPGFGFESDSGKINAYVSILPQAYFVEQVGGEYVEVKVMVGPGQSPATYDPTPRQMSDLEHARVYFRIGVPFENQMLRKIREVFRHLEIVDTQTGIELKHHETLEGHEGHDHGYYDPHTWLDPLAVKVIAKNIYETLVMLDPTHQSDYENNLAGFETELDSLHHRIEIRLKPYAGRRILVFHPVYGYFADRYGLRQTAVEIEGKEPSARQLAKFIEKARADNIKIIFVQPQFSTKSAETIARAIGGTVMKADPLAADYLTNLEKIAAQLAEGLEKK